MHKDTGSYNLYNLYKLNRLTCGFKFKPTIANLKLNRHRVRICSIYNARLNPLHQSTCYRSISFSYQTSSCIQRVLKLTFIQENNYESCYRDRGYASVTVRF